MAKYAYFTGNDSERFHFVMIPYIFFEDEKLKKLSSDAKILYGLMLGKMNLSRKNGWLDEKGRVYIRWSNEELCKDLGRSEPTVVKIKKELEKEGLIEKDRKGLGKCDLIYVKDACKKQGYRSDLTSRPGGEKFSPDDLADQEGYSQRQIERYILTELNSNLLNLVDLGEIPIKAAVEISFLDGGAQELIYSALSKDKRKKLSVEKAKHLRELSERKKLDDLLINDAIVGQKTEKEGQICFYYSELKEFFPVVQDPYYVKKEIIFMMKEYSKNTKKIDTNQKKEQKN